MSYGGHDGYGGPEAPRHGQQWGPAPGHQPGAQRAGSGVVLAFVAVLTVLAVALLGAIAYLFLRPGGGSGDGPGGVAAQSSASSSPPSSPPTSTPPPPVTETAYTTPPPRETVTVTREPPAPRIPRGGGRPVGTDSSGWLSDRQARCNAGDPASMVGRTTQAAFSICVNPDNGRYYYRGSSGGAGVEIDDPTVTRAGAVVTNDDVLYSIDASGMSIYQGGDLISSQPMLVFWTG